MGQPHSLAVVGRVYFFSRTVLPTNFCREVSTFCEAARFLVT